MKPLDLLAVADGMSIPDEAPSRAMTRAMTGGGAPGVVGDGVVFRQVRRGEAPDAGAGR